MTKTSILAVAFAATLGLTACGGKSDTAAENNLNAAAADLNATVDAAEADLNAALDNAADATVAADAAANSAAATANAQ